MLKSVMKFAARTTFAALGSVALIVALGVAVNLAAFYYLPNMCDLPEAGQVGASLFGCTLALVVGLVLLLAFPMAYLVVAYKYGLQKALHFAYVENKARFYEYFSVKMTAYTDAVQSSKSGNFISAAGNFLDKLDNVPFLFRSIINFLKKRIPFLELIENMSERLNVDFSAGNAPQVASELALEADRYIKDELLEPDKKLLLTLLAVNAAVIGLLFLIL